MSTITTEQVQKVVVASLEDIDADAGDINRDATIEKLASDSLDLAELMMNIEDAFKDHIGDNIPESDAEKFETVGSVVEFLRSKGVPEEVN